MLDGGTGREGRGGLAAPSQLGTGQSTGGGSAGHYSLGQLLDLLDLHLDLLDLHVVHVQVAKLGR